jgi:hypothetical protein
MEWKVWYRPEGATGAGFSREQDKGSLTIESDSAVFEGSKKHISFDQIRSVGKQRIGLWLSWADIEYEENGEVHHAFFGDRRLLGWAGMLGSNMKIAEAAEAVRAGRTT